MKSGNDFERLWRLQASLDDLVLKGKRSPGQVADLLQQIIETPLIVVNRREPNLLVDLDVVGLVVEDSSVVEHREGGKWQWDPKELKLHLTDGQRKTRDGGVSGYKLKK